MDILHSRLFTAHRCTQARFHATFHSSQFGCRVRIVSLKRLGWLTNLWLTQSLDPMGRLRVEQTPIHLLAGHVPGAVNRPFSSNLDEDRRFLPHDELRHQFEQRLGGYQPEQVVNMCCSGVNACQSLLAMEIAGLPGSRVYAGSWSEWIRNPVSLREQRRQRTAARPQSYLWRRIFLTPSNWVLRSGSA